MLLGDGFECLVEDDVTYLCVCGDAWAEEQAKALAEQALGNSRAVLQVSLYETEAEAIGLISKRGFVKEREWVHLVIELEGVPPIPTLPDDVSIRPMDLANDWKLVRAVRPEVS